jgi:hypothetical protein
MSLPTLSISPQTRFTTDLFRYQTAVTSFPAEGTLVTSLLSAICVILICFLANPWLAVAAFIPAYGLFWLNVWNAMKQR